MVKHADDKPPQIDGTPGGNVRIRRVGRGGLWGLAVSMCLLALAGCGSTTLTEPSGFTLPSSEDATPLLRTDASRPDRWAALLAAIRVPNEHGFLAFVAPLADPALEGLTEARIRELPRAVNAETFVLVADAHALDDDAFPILVIDLSGDERPSFRVTARCLWAVQNNLSIANMDWEDFTSATDAAGVVLDC